MSILAPFYLLGALAVGLPILFHLIRRRPKGEVEFSSLMFLKPTPPRLTKRSRLENWPLLLMRALALLLLAIAFARPFLRGAAFSQQGNLGRRLMLVVDTSASMQRADLWDQAKEKADAVIDDLTEGDQLAIVTFDREPTTRLSYEQSAELTLEQLKKTARVTVADASPTWHATNMGSAISYAADAAVTYEPDDDATSDGTDPEQKSGAANQGPAHMILISDMQSGSSIESLQVYTWPKELKMDVRRVAVKNRTNASAQILSETKSDDGGRVRVRVTNSDSDAEASRFRIAWAGEGATSIELPVQVPPGESRVVRMPIPDANVTSLVVRDDAHSFDNQRYLVSPQPEALTMLYLGSEASANSKVSDSRDSLLFYLQRIPLDNSQRKVTVLPLEPAKLVTPPDTKTTPLVVVGEPISTDTAKHLKQYVADGGRVLFVMANEFGKDMQPAIAQICETKGFDVSEAKVGDYAMLSQIDFGHPVFRRMSDPQFNDFTKVRFWSHRKIDSLADDWQSLAMFDDGDPALLEHVNGDGRVWVLTTGWEPKSSQLALSTKFLPLVYGFFGVSGGEANQYGSVAMGEPIPYQPSPAASITGPDGMQLAYQTAEDVDQISQPGVYTFADDDLVRSFAVNLPESESQTKPLEDDVFQRFGVDVGEALSVAQTRANQRQLRDIELEKKQRLWQWLLVAALALLAIETLWGGVISRPSAAPAVTDQ